MKTLANRSVATALAIVLLALSGLTILPAPAAAQKEKKAKPIESYSAFVITSSPGSRIRARLSITRWSSNEERDQLLEVLKKNDTVAFRDAMGKMEQVGTFMFSDTVGYPVRYAKKFMGDDGSWQIIAATDRPLSGSDILGTDSERHYYISIIEINSDPEGNLQAVVSPGSELIWDEKTQMLDLKNWSGMLYGLSHVRKLK